MTITNPIEVPKSLVPLPCQLVIFGGTGDLAWRKLLPAVYNLNVEGVLPAHFAVVAFGLPAEGPTQADPDEFMRGRARDGIDRFSRRDLDESHWNDFARSLFFVQGSFNDSRAYAQLKAKLDALDQQFGIPGSRVFYLAVPPQVVRPCVEHLREAGMIHDPSEQAAFTRVIVEKPIGRDLDSAREVIRIVGSAFAESQTYRIDHYLGKETVQNILVFRFSNGIFEPIWNRRYIDHVQISVSETVGVEQRGSYYDHAGALRDMVPNHIMQLISLTAMEPPVSFQANAVRDEQAKILHAIQPLSAEDVLSRTVRGQYSGGSEEKQRVPGYREEEDVPPDSKTETFVAMKLAIDNWRWADVPFYLRTGKRLASQNTQIVIQFRRAPFVLFRDTPVENLMPNQLVLHIQPQEGISLQFAAKVPGPIMHLGAVDMNFQYADYFGTQPSTGYERLLHDAMIGDATLFQRADMVEAGWCVVSPVLDVWKALPPRNFPNYPAGTWGPREADELLERDGRRWRNFD